MAQTVLIVDDNELVRVLASRILEGAGFVPVAVASGPSALHFLESHVFDLVMVDFVMPEMLGDEFIRRVRAHRNSAVRRIPVLGLAGSHRDAEALFAAAGASGCISKPFKDEPLLAAVRRLLLPSEGLGLGGFLAAGGHRTT